MRKALGETPAQVMRRHPPARIYRPGPLDELHALCVAQRIEAELARRNRVRTIAVEVPRDDN